MNKLYNTFDDIANNFRNCLQSVCSFLPKTALNIMPEILTAMIVALPCVTKDIALKCKGQKFDFNQSESQQKTS